MDRAVPTRRAVLAGLGAAFAAPALALDAGEAVRPRLRPGAVAKPAQGASTPEVAAIVDEANLGGRVAFVVADARTGQLLETRSQLVGMPPASVTKTATALYGLDHLGSDYRFRTRLVATGPVQDKMIQGDLVLVTGGDPTLDTDELGDMAEALSKAGVSGVTGRFLVWEPPYPEVPWIDPGQPFQVSYNPGVGALNLNLNRVHFEWKRTGKDYQVTMEARGLRYRPGVHTSTMQIVDRAAPVYDFVRSDGVDHWTVARGALGKDGSRWLPVRAPRDYALDALQAILAFKGIRVPQPVRTVNLPAGEVIYEVASQPLAEILHYMLKESINLTAEVVGLSASLASGARPTSLRASAGAMSDWLARVSKARHPKFVDHSGLSESNHVTPYDMVASLVYAKPDGALARLMKPWYFRNAQGGYDKSSAVDMVAKTGTLNFVSALAGFIRPPEGRPLAFAIFTENEGLRAGLSREERERPSGGKSWGRRSRVMQDRLLKRWATLYA